MPDIATIQLFTDAQFGTLLGALGAITTAAGLGARWAINRIVKAMDESTEARVALAASQATQAVAMSLVVDKVDDVHSHWLGRGPPR